MRIKVTLPAEAARVLKELYEAGELAEIGAENLSIVSGGKSGLIGKLLVDITDIDDATVAFMSPLLVAAWETSYLPKPVLVRIKSRYLLRWGKKNPNRDYKLIQRLRTEMAIRGWHHTIREYVISRNDNEVVIDALMNKDEALHFADQVPDGEWSGVIDSVELYERDRPLSLENPDRPVPNKKTALQEQSSDDASPNK